MSLHLYFPRLYPLLIKKPRAEIMLLIPFVNSHLLNFLYLVPLLCILIFYHLCVLLMILLMFLLEVKQLNGRIRPPK